LVCNKKNDEYKLDLCNAYLLTESISKYIELQ